MVQRPVQEVVLRTSHKPIANGGCWLAMIVAKPGLRSATLYFPFYLFPCYPLSCLLSFHTLALCAQSSDLAVWMHPLDVTYACTTVSGWPKLIVEVFHTDEENRVDFGTAHHLCFPPLSSLLIL